MPRNTSSSAALWSAPATVALVRAAIEEDVGSGDITTQALLDPDSPGRAVIRARATGRVCGLPIVERVYRAIDRRVRVRLDVREGAAVQRSRLMCRIEGPRASLLTGERSALNFVQRLSGIATLTARCVAAAKPFGVKILDTRKTTPGWRDLEKYAVRCGGGTNHRRGLYDAVLIKDNHLQALAHGGGILLGGRAGFEGEKVRVAVGLARRRYGYRFPVEVEVQSLAELEGALTSDPDIVMLDNFSPPRLAQALARVRLENGRRRALARARSGRTPRAIRVEISGGVSPANVAEVARFRPDFISMGALTHSAPAFDCSMEFE